MKRGQDDKALLQNMLQEMDAIARFLERGARDDELKAQFTDIPWREMKDMRNVLIHHYFGVDVSRVWQVVDVELPVLKEKISKRISSLEC